MQSPTHWEGAQYLTQLRCCTTVSKLGTHLNFYLYIFFCLSFTPRWQKSSQEIFFITIKKGPEGSFSLSFSSLSRMAWAHTKYKRELGYTSMVQHLPRMLMCEIQYSALEIIISTFLNQKSCRNAQGWCSGLCYWEQNTEVHYCSISRLVQLLSRLISLLVDKYLKISKTP